MEPEIPEDYSLIKWIVVLGICLIVIAGASAYILANPESLYSLFGWKTSKSVPAPITTVNGASVSPHEQAPHTKHYTNIFFEFDYPDNFTITNESVVTTHEGDNTKKDTFGSTEITLTASSSANESYEIKITSVQNSEHTSALDETIKAKNDFFARPDRGANDSYQDITVSNHSAYKYFSNGKVHVGIPSDNLNYAFEITWIDEHGVRGIANSYLGVLEDSFTPK